MTMPISEPLPPDEPQPEDHLAAARRRRQYRLAAAEGSERGEFLADLVHQGTATLDFYLFALLSGIVLIAAILLDAPALYLLAALLAPFMAPVVGMALATAAGSLRLFVRSLVSLVIGGLVVAGMGALAGAIGSGTADLSLQQAALHARFSLPDMILLALGTIVAVFLVVHNPRSRPSVSSVALAYELFPALGAAGFGLVSNLSMRTLPGLWPDGLVVFAAYTALAVVVGAVAFIFQGIHATRVTGFLVTVLLLVLTLAATIILMLPANLEESIFPVSPAATATLQDPTLSPQPSATITPLATGTGTPQLPTSTSAPTRTVAPTGTPTRTLVPSATPVWGLVNAGAANGVIIRSEPNSLTVVTTLLNGNLIQILPEQVNKAGVIWIHVRTTGGLEGWVQAALIVTATPSR